MGHHDLQRHLVPRQGPSPPRAAESGNQDGPGPTSSSASSSVSSSSSSVSSVSSSSSRVSSSSSSTSSSSRSSSRSSSSTSSAVSSSSSSSSIVTSEKFLVTSAPSSISSLVAAPSNLFANPSTLETSNETETAAEEPSNTAQSNIGASNKGFWANKSAVAGTFTVVSLIGVAALGFFWMMILKRRRKRPSFNDSVYDRFAEPALRDSARTPSPGPSTVELHQTPMEPQDSYRDLFYHSQQAPTQYNDYGNYSAQPSFPPTHNNYNQNNNYAYNANDLLPDPVPVPAPMVVKQRAPHEPPPSHNLPASLFTSPTPSQAPYANAIASGKLAPVSFQTPVARGSYQPSIDSFYGGIGNAAGK